VKTSNRSTGRCLAVVILAGMLLYLPGCTRSGKIERALVSQITQSCRHQAPCQIQVDQATWFDWDKMYAFKYTATEPDRQKALGMKDDGYRDLERQLIFLKNGNLFFRRASPRTLNIRLRMKSYSTFLTQRLSKATRAGRCFPLHS
jgi:hypothetical protein